MGSPELQASRRECPPFAARSKIAPGNTPVAGNHNIDVAVAKANLRQLLSPTIYATQALSPFAHDAGRK